ncbi:MAG TPA: cysteine peptidase family C39 domain-containing protein [Bacilli bacterium]|nr:cysteine peptidase family C39 domain-containing protein [Bacilli bacterium]
MYYIPQIGEFDCGFACLKMLMAHIHKDKNYLYLPFHEKNQTFSYQQLTTIALKYNIELVGFRVEDEEEIKKNKVFPLIVSLNQENDNKHAVIISSLKWNRVQISDPAKGTYSLSFKKFFSLWDKTGLLIKNYADTPCPFIYQNNIKMMDYIIPFFCQVMTGISGVLSVYFFDKNIPFFIPLLLLIAFGFFEVLLRRSLFKLMNRIDNDILQRANIKGKDYHSFHQRFEKFKQMVMSTPLNFLYVFLICAFLVFIILINDPKNILLIIAPLLITIFDAFCLKPFLKNKEEDIARVEKALLKSKDIEDFRQREFTLHDKTYQYGKIVLLKKYTFILIMLIATCSLLIANQQFSIPFIVFYLSVEFALYSNLSKLFSFSEERSKYLEAKIAICNVLHQNDEII